MNLAKIRNLIISLFFAVVLVVMAALSGCVIETAHPSARITIEFNGTQYELNYKLYRNMYPQTVRHFIELADEGFYDNMIVHDYTSSNWYTGGYSYNASAENGDDVIETDYSTYVNGGDGSVYLEYNSKEDEYYELFNEGKLTASVYEYYTYDEDGNQVVEKGNALPTLMGEFYGNISQEIESGALSESYGCLKMYYNSKVTTQKVYVTPTKNQIIAADYKYNCATSIFMIQTGTSSTSYTSSEYCIFAELKDTDPLDDLIDAISDYLDAKNLSSTDFTVTADTTVDNNESFSDEYADSIISASYAMTVEPIKIVSVKVTGY